MRPIVNIDKKGTFSGHTDCIYTLYRGLSFSDFYTAGGDGLIVRWDLDVPDQGTLVTKVENSVYAIRVLLERKLLLVCENLKGIRILDLELNKEVAAIPLPGLTFFDICHYGGLLIIATHTGKVLLYNLDTLTVVDVLDYCDKSARCIKINEESAEFAIGYSDGQIRIFDLKDLSLKHMLKEAHGNSVFTLTYDQDSQYLLSAGRDAHIKHWDVKAGYTLLKSVPAHLFAINHLEYRPDGQYFASCSMDKSIKIWDAHTLSLIKVIDKSRHAGHGTSVNKMLWLDQALVSVSDDRKISVWNVDIQSV